MSGPKNATSDNAPALDDDREKKVPAPGVIDRWVSFVIRFYLPILIVAGLASWVSFETAKGLKLDANIISLMPEGVPSVENLRKVIKKTGGYSSAMVVVESPDPDAAVAFLTDLRERVKKFDWVTSAEFAEDTAVFSRNRLIYIDADDLKRIDQQLAKRVDYEKKNLQFTVEGTEVKIQIRGETGPEPSLEFKDLEEKYKKSKFEKKEPRYFRDETGNITILVVLPEGSTTNVKYARTIVAQLREAIDAVDPAKYHKDMVVSLGGRITRLVAKFDAIMSDIRGSALWSISAILLALVFFYRRFMAVLYIGLPLIVGFLLTFAITKVTLGGLNLITVFLVLILFGLGIDFGIHNLARYDEVRANGGDMRKALRIIYSRTGQASLLAAITTIVGFFSLMLMDFKAFYEFGFIAGMGVMLTLVTMYLVFPAIMVLAEKARIYRIRRWHQVSLERRRTVFPAARVILITGLAVTIAAGAESMMLKFEDDFGKLETELPKDDVIKEKVKLVFPLRADKAVVFVDELKDVDAVVKEVERIKNSRPPEQATIDKVKSIYSVVPKLKDQQERLQIIDHIQAQLKEAEQLLEDFAGKDDKRVKEIEKLLDYFGISALRPEDLPTPIQRQYTGVPGSGGYLVYIFNLHGTSKFTQAKAFVDDIREIKANGKTFYPATETMVFVDMLTLMKKDASLAVGIVLVSILLVLVFAFRNLRHVIFIITPVAIGLVWLLGIMAVFDIRLNIFNMVVLPTVLGIGIDNAIHIFHRYREEGGRVWRVVRTTGGAAFLTTLTTMLGFAGTLTASNQGLQSLGLVACVGLGCCMISSLTVYPALLQWSETRRLKREQASSET